jgi:cytochrome P450
MRATLADLFADTGHTDAVESLCKPYPSRVIATVMGAPLEDAARLWDWSNWIQRQFGMKVLEERPQIEKAVSEFYDWAARLLERRRDEPGDDLISTLITAHFEGDKLDDDELINLVLNVLVGGVDTTQSQLAHALRLFAEHPEQWSMLAENPMLAPAAVEEVVRFEPITPFTARIAMEDVEYRDVLFPKDTVVMVAACTANRDQLDTPHDFDIERPASKPVTFGAGVHYCLGANLARAELEEALAFLAPRMPGLALDGPPVYDSVNGIYGLEALPVRFG